MSAHSTATRSQWLEARIELLEAEKDLTRRSDELARRRQELPWVPVEKQYSFETADGTKSLAELFGGRSQLLVYHFMYGPDYSGGCPSCSLIADGFDGIAVHLENHDVALAAVSRAPFATLDAYRRRMGWSFTWASSEGSDFNYDFSTSFTEEQQATGSVGYNYRDQDTTWVRRAGNTGHPAMCGVDAATYIREMPGMSAFVLEDGVVHHTYSAFARGLDGLWGMYAWLDRAPKGRNEGDGTWWRRHDEYDAAA